MGQRRGGGAQRRGDWSPRIVVCRGGEYEWRCNFLVLGRCIKERGGKAALLNSARRGVVVVTVWRLMALCVGLVLWGWDHE